MRLSTCVMALAFVSAMACWIWLLALAGRSFHGELVLAIALITLASSIAALPCARALERGKYPIFMKWALLAALVCAAGWSLIVWLAFSSWMRPDQLWVGILGSLSVFAGWSMIFALLMVHRMTGPFRTTVRGCTIAVASILAVVIWMPIVNPQSLHRHEWEFAQMLGVLVVLTLAGMLLTIILARLKQLTTGVEDNDDQTRLSFSAWCPRCQHEQTLQTGGAACARCGLEIKVMIP